MNVKETLEQRGVEVDRRDYENHLELVADFGPDADASVDVVGETVIVVVDSETYDLEIDGEAQAFIKNGVFTIELREETQP